MQYTTLVCVLSIFARSEPEDHIVGVAALWHKIQEFVPTHMQVKLLRHAFPRDDPNSVS